MKQIDVQELKEKLKNHPNIHIIDVREPDEFEEYNIGAVSLPLSKLKQMDTDPIDDWNEDEEIIVHCSSGKRSIEACLLLETMGYSNVVNFKDSLKDLKEYLGDQKIK